MNGWENKFKYIKICLISPALEIVFNIIYITSFIIILTFLWLEGKYYNDNQILKFTKSYIDYDSFYDIKNSSEMKAYISNLMDKLYIIDPTREKLPIFIPLNPVRISFFLNEGCEESDFTSSCSRSFSCALNSLSTSFKHQCLLRYIKKDNKNSQKKLFLEDLVSSITGYYSTYNLINDGENIDITYINYSQNIDAINSFIDNKNLKFISLQINLNVPINNNYVDVILGLEMNQYFNNIKKFNSIDIYNSYRPGHNPFLLSVYIIFYISTMINIIKLIYEIMIKFIWSVQLFAFIGEILDILLIIFSIFYIIIDKQLSLKTDLTQFESHLIYSTVRKYVKVIMIFVIIGIPLRFLSLLSWLRGISYPITRFVIVLLRMLPGATISFLVFFIFTLFFSLINYFIFNDIYSEYQSFYISFINIFNFKLLTELYDQNNNSKIFHNLTQSKYVFIILLFEVIFFLFSFAIFISTFVYLFKRAVLIESPKQENEYINKLKQIQEKLKDNESDEKNDSIKIKKQVLWLKLSNKSSCISESNQYEIILFKNSNQIISFLKYLFALKPDLQFKKLVNRFNIVVEISSDDESYDYRENIQIDKLVEWLTFVGCKIPVIIYCEKKFNRNFQMKLYFSYNLIQFIHDKEELNKIINKKDYGKFNIVNDIGFSINSIKHNIISDD